ncbi:Acetyltransferase involved in cellulose biosynthesis, CelD/BcsL family [Blastococcus aggregatus]|uniref:Acetyltransferase involved in cellulose biosynthesis, CelD/BcsL family n=1 Tax=Blastococcus aggregatus TaxID=38502 RepID=A0A285V0Y6_9ACTN|nr:GNAT family N-acetyltransferase [Blastococcus aggregatus]SOC47729.1 Acetyltransferase involved in cellulose biosynthesis, CelD/BcsL family [Blastococcus aggregatus]
MATDERKPGSAVRCLTSVADVRRSTAGWDALPSRSGPVGGSAWVRAWLEVYGSRHTLAVGVAGAPDAPDAVLPLVRRRGRPWTAEMLGVRQLLEPTDARGSDPAALAALVEDVVRRGQPVRLKRLPDDSPLLPHLRALPVRRAAVLDRAVAGTPAIALSERWREPEHHFSKRRRGDFRTALRRAEGLGEVEFSVEQPAPGEVDALFEEITVVEAAGWKTAAGTSLVARPDQREFFRRFCTLAAEQDATRFAFLRIDGRPVAVQLAVEAHGRYSLFKIGFDEQFARCSPGNLLMLHTVRWAAERGLETFEFLGTEEPWTSLWTDVSRSCREVHVYPTAWRSVPAAAVVAGEMARRSGTRALTRLRERGAP